MPRLLFAFVIGVLTISASGLESVFVDEPCGITEQSNSDDGACAPTCVTCGCCARAIEPVGVALVSNPGRQAPPAITLARHLPLVDPADVLHVPKSLLS